MGDCSSVDPILEGEEQLIEAVRDIVKALKRNTNLTDDTRKILADLGAQLCSLTKVSVCGIKERLNFVQDKVMKWEVDQSMIWDCGREEADEYLKAVDEARKLVESLESSNLTKDSEEEVLLRRANDILQMAMAKLEEEFKHLLVQNRQPFEPEHMSFRSSEEEVVDEGSFNSSGDDSVEEVVRRESIGRGSEDYIIELVHPEVIPELKRIANAMFDSNYARECSQALISVRKDALDDCLFILEVEKLSIEDVLRMEWNILNSKMRRWVRTMKIFVRVYLASEKWLCDQIFGELESASPVCFAEASKASIFQLLNFGEAVAIGPHEPEKLARVLDMCEVLADLIRDINALYDDDTGLCVRMECQDVLRRLGDCAKATFLDFETAVASNLSTTPFPRGGNHPLTTYVMNYLRTLSHYSSTLEVLLKDNENDESVSYSPDMSPVAKVSDLLGDSASCVSPMALHFLKFMSILESNLNDKSKLYKDESLQHLFLMNNIHYMAEKVKRSELRTILGDKWIRKQNGKFQQHEMKFQRATWIPILSLLKDEGIYHPGSHPISKTLVKERLQSFYLSFEEVYKNQTGWVIPDSQLREDVRISMSKIVIPPYRSFVEKHANLIGERHIKYSVDDVENYILHLFEGSQKSLHHSHKK